MPLGDTIELQCTVLHWGDGEPDLKFHLFDSDGAILRDEVTLDKRDKSLYFSTKLDRYHHGKKFGKENNKKIVACPQDLVREEGVTFFLTSFRVITRTIYMNKFSTQQDVPFWVLTELRHKGNPKTV